MHVDEERGEKRDNMQMIQNDKKKGWEMIKRKNRKLINMEKLFKISLTLCQMSFSCFTFKMLTLHPLQIQVSKIWFQNFHYFLA